MSTANKWTVPDTCRHLLEELAKELLDARTDEEFAGAARAMAAVLENYDIKGELR